MDPSMINEARDFFEEIGNQLPDIESTIMNLSSGNGTPDDINKIFRFFHNVKGTGGLFEITLLQEVFHVAESFLDVYRSKKIMPDAQGVDLILMAVDEFKNMSKYIIEQGKEPEGKPYRLLANLVEMTNSIGKDKSEDTETKSTENDVEEKHNANKQESIRITGEQLNKLAELVSQFFYLQNGLLDILGDNLTHKEIKTDIKNFSECLQQLLLSIRLAPLRPLLINLQRVVKSTAAQVNKDIDFKIIGDDVGLDRKIIELIREPMIHLLRNSIDHGIEASEIRKRNNKNPKGLITVETVQKASHVLIHISDDGQGLNKEIITRKAIEKGLISKDDAQNMDNKEIYKLIFAPGFSTKDEASTISGRGVGMDSVKTMVETVGGSIDLESNPGIGSKITLNLPASLAVVKTISFYIGKQLFAVPRENIDEVYSKGILQANNRIKMLADGVMTLDRHTYSIPIIDMQNLFHQTEHANESGSIIVLKHGTNLVAMDVGPMYKPMNFIAHSLPDQFEGNEYVSGINQLNNGEYIALINVLSIIKQVESLPQNLTANNKKIISDGKTISDFFRSKQKVITFSYGEKNFALAVQSVKEVFLIDEEKHKVIKDGIEYIDYEGKCYPTIILKEHFKTEEPQYGKKIMAILLKNTALEAVILCEKFHGVQGLPPEFESTIKTKGLLGVINFGESSYLCLNCNELFTMAFPHKFKNTVLDHEKTHFVLIVEDDSFFMKTICSYFESHKIQYKQAFNGEEAIEILQNKDEHQIIDFILTDYEMPVMNGLELLKWLQAHKSFADIPSMMLTAVGDSATRKDAYDSGVNYFINKMNFEKALEKIVSKIKTRIKTGVFDLHDFKDEQFSGIANEIKFQERLLTFKLWNNFYGLPISSIKDYSMPSKTTQMPLSPQYIDSIVAFRGHPIPLLDLRRMKQNISDLGNEKSELIMMLPSGNLCALWVDSVYNVVSLENLKPAVGIEKRTFKTGLMSLIGNIYLNNETPIALLDSNRLEMFIRLIFERHYEKLANDPGAGMTTLKAA